MTQRIIYWFRNDLRLEDNEAFFSALHAAQEVIPVYVFDPRQFAKTKLGFRRASALRAQFLIDTVAALRTRIQELGGELLIRIGEAEKIVAELAEEHQAEYVYTSKEIGPEETRNESSLSKNLKVGNVDIKLFWMDTLIHAVDLPFPISKLPMTFEEFAKMIDGHPKIKKPLPSPEKITVPALTGLSALPSLQHLGFEQDEIASITSRVSTATGETGAQQTLLTYLGSLSGSQDIPATLADSGISKWLALGCVSARSIYNAIRSQKQTPHTQAMIRDLLGRDYFHWLLLRFGPRIFKPSGTAHHFTKLWLNDHAVFESWTNAQTADAEVNRIMQKLTGTGFLTQAERTQAASYLADVLQVNWTWGAMYFESHLADYEVAVNWGMWNNIAGVGTC
jgi:deoxyribodipyrimidine photo-lyase